jgi:hypothetical protein
MSKGTHDIFALVINFLGIVWQPKHITFGHPKTIDLLGKLLVKKLIELLEKYNLKKKIVYVKDEGSNLNTRTFTLKEVVNCDILSLEESYQSTYFGHVFSKAYQYATTIEKNYKYLTYVSIKIAQGDL